jgi:ribosomal protein S19
MTIIIIKIILGLFVFLALPEIICKKWKISKDTKRFVNITCKIIGFAFFVYAGIDFVQLIFEK